VRALRRDPASLLNSTGADDADTQGISGIRAGSYRIPETDKPGSIFAHAGEDEAGHAVLAVHNLSCKSEPVKVRFWKNDFDHKET
jgi:hypothetical protein